MNTEERIKKQKELIEEIGRFYDSEGLQPITGRVFAMLMILDKEQFTFEEIAEELQISKASTSNALRNLETREVIEYITVPGDRKKYFRLKWKDEFTLIDDFKRKLRCVKDLHKKILDLKA